MRASPCERTPKSATGNAAMRSTVAILKGPALMAEALCMRCAAMEPKRTHGSPLHVRGRDVASGTRVVASEATTERGDASARELSQLRVPDPQQLGLAGQDRVDVGIAVALALLDEAQGVVALRFAPAHQLLQVLLAMQRDFRLNVLERL